MKSIRKISAVTLALALGLAFVPHAQAALSPLSVSAVPPVQFPPGDYSVTGLRASALFGKHRNVYGIDLGLLGNVTEQEFTGLALSGIFNLTKGATRAIGLQAAGITNINTGKAKVYGAQLALGMNVNTAESAVNGLQFALLGNLSEFTTIRGFQVGLYNRAQTVYGFQIGLVNVTQNLKGLQIGLLNFNHTGLFYVSPILNFGF